MLNFLVTEWAKALTRKGVVFFLTVSALIVTVFLGGFLLIGVYHTTIWIVMKLTPALFFTLVPTATLFFAAGVIFLKDPVHNLLCLIAVFFSVVLFYLYVGAEFLAFLFLIVYVGAIAILFLFVIMLLHLKEVKTVRSTQTSSLPIEISTPLYFLPVIGIDDVVSEAISTFLTCCDLLSSSADATTIESLIHYITSRHSDILIFSELLYTYYSFLFYLSAMLLLTAMLGAIILATSATDREENHWTATLFSKISDRLHL